MELVVDCVLQSYRGFLERLTYGLEETTQNIIPCLEVFDLYMEVGQAPEFLHTFTPTFDAFLAMVLSRSGPLHGAKALPKSIPPARLRKVLLCVEDIDEGYQRNSVDNLLTRSQILVPPHTQLKIFCDSEKQLWLQQEIETW
jgi:hypothetical protein